MNEHTLYMECYSGISSRTAAAALLDLGADAEALKTAVRSLPADGEAGIGRTSLSGMDACELQAIREPRESMKLKDLLAAVRRAEMTDPARRLAERAFEILAAGEAAARGADMEQVRLYGSGAMDSIWEIVAFAVCFDSLNIREVIIPQLCEGRGITRSRHGVLPVPVPAVSHIMAEHGLKLRIVDSEGQSITPEGAAVAAAVATGDRLPERFTIQKIGIGAGGRSSATPSGVLPAGDGERAGYLRAMLIRPEWAGQDLICKLESDIDDCSGEILGYVMERLLEAGARDVHYMPVFMKKNRPAYQLNVLCEREKIPVLERIIFEETTTIGIRRTAMERTVLNREIRTVRTEWGEARVKICELPSGPRCYPEYDSVREISRKTGLPCYQVYQEILQRLQIMDFR